MLSMMIAPNKLKFLPFDDATGEPVRLLTKGGATITGRKLVGGRGSAHQGGTYRGAHLPVVKVKVPNESRRRRGFLLSHSSGKDPWAKVLVEGHGTVRVPSLQADQRSNEHIEWLGRSEFVSPDRLRFTPKPHSWVDVRGLGLAYLKSPLTGKSPDDRATVVRFTPGTRQAPKPHRVMVRDIVGVHAPRFDATRIPPHLVGAEPTHPTATASPVVDDHVDHEGITEWLNLSRNARILRGITRNRLRDYGLGFGDFEAVLQAARVGAWRKLAEGETDDRTVFRNAVRHSSRQAAELRNRLGLSHVHGDESMRAARAFREAQTKLGRNPTDQELAEQLNAMAGEHRRRPHTAETAKEALRRYRVMHEVPSVVQTDEGEQSIFDGIHAPDADTARLLGRLRAQKILRRALRRSVDVLLEGDRDVARLVLDNPHEWVEQGEHRGMNDHLRWQIAQLLNMTEPDVARSWQRTLRTLFTEVKTHPERYRGIEKSYRVRAHARDRDATADAKAVVPDSLRGLYGLRKGSSLNTHSVNIVDSFAKRVRVPKGSEHYPDYVKTRRAVALLKPRLVPSEAIRGKAQIVKRLRDGWMVVHHDSTGHVLTNGLYSHYRLDRVTSDHVNAIHAAHEHVSDVHHRIDSSRVEWGRLNAGTDVEHDPAARKWAAQASRAARGLAKAMKRVKQWECPECGKFNSHEQDQCSRCRKFEDARVGMRAYLKLHPERKPGRWFGLKKSNCPGTHLDKSIPGITKQHWMMKRCQYHGWQYDPLSTYGKTTKIHYWTTTRPHDVVMKLSLELPGNRYLVGMAGSEHERAELTVHRQVHRVFPRHHPKVISWLRANEARLQKGIAAFELNKHIACQCHPDHAFFVHVGGLSQFKRHPATICKRCKRLTLRDPGATANGMSKAIDSSCFRDPKSCGLRWITVHPGGVGEGVPLLVHDNGEEYTVVGGAGGKMNQMVLKKPTGTGDQSAAAQRRLARRGRHAKRIEAVRKEFGEDFDRAEQARQAIRSQVKEQTAGLHERVRQMVGAQVTGDMVGTVRKEAERRARRANPKADASEVNEFADQAERKLHDEARGVVARVIDKAIEKQALRALGDDDGSSAEVEHRLSGKRLVKQLTDDQIAEIVGTQANLSAMKKKERLIARALRDGNQETLQGIDATVSPLGDDEIKRQNLNRYLTERDVNIHTELVRDSELAPVIVQRRHQTAGAADALNGVVGAHTNNAILHPDVVHQIGIENASRVAAAHLKAQGAAVEKLSGELRTRIAQHSTAAAAAAIQQVEEMDALVDHTRKAAATGDGSVTKAQSSIMAANMAQQKYQLLNTARGQLRSAAALAHYLEHDVGDDMVIAAGASRTGARTKARGLGLGHSDYQIRHAGGGGYAIHIPASKVAQLAQPHSVVDAGRSAEMDELRNEVASKPGQWKPQGLHKDILLKPHQELAVRAIVGQKRMVLNHGAGSGKTAILYSAAAHLMNTDKIDRALVTMPAKPRSQQRGERGEAAKFLDPEMAKRVTVIEDGRDLRRHLASVKAGEKKILVMSPQMMRDHVGALVDAGFGGERSMLFADEAHELAIGGHERGSNMAKQARRLAGAEYMAAGSGTLIENNASELHSVYSLVHPGALGTQKDFAKEWQRLAQGAHSGGHLFADESMRSMRNRLSGGMVSYHEQPTRRGKRGDEPVKLTRDTVTVNASAGQRTQIAEINRKYQEDRSSVDPEVYKAAALRRRMRVMQVLNGADDNPKHDAIRRIIAGEKKRDPKNRVGVYAFETAALGGAGKHMDKKVRITGAEDDRATARAVGALNDRTNDIEGVLLSNAANYGLNLHGMDHLVKLHPLDTPSKEDQLDHRHFRAGQTRDVRATTILTDHPIEQLTQFRTTRVKLPEVALLALLADDTGTAHALTGSMDALREAAGRA